MKLMRPVARVSFCIQRYHDAQRRSKTLSWTLYLETSSKTSVRVMEDELRPEMVEFL